MEKGAMSSPEQRIAAATAQLQGHHEALVEEALEAYFRSLPRQRFPRRDELDAAEQRARVCLRRTMWSAEWLQAMGEEAADQDECCEALKLTFLTQTRPFRAPLPPSVQELQPRLLGYGAAVGAVLGLLVFMLLHRLLVGPVQLGLGVLLAGPFGAFCMVVALGWLSHHGHVRRLLQGALGAAGVAEVWLAVSGTVNPLARVWRRLTHRHPHWSLARRLLVYLAVILLLQLSVRRPAYYGDDHAEAVRHALDQWLAGAERLQAAMWVCARFAPAGHRGNEQLANLARHLYSIHSSTMDELPISAAELLQEARNAGFERIEGEPVFLANDRELKVLTWHEDMEEFYERFGAIRPGQPVRVEREAIVQEGCVLRRGLVRKARGEDSS
jgi:hypothetical protein